MDNLIRARGEDLAMEPSIPCDFRMVLAPDCQTLIPRVLPDRVELPVPGTYVDFLRTVDALWPQN